MRMRAWLVALLQAGTPVLAAKAGPHQTLEQTRREVRATARALNQADEASALELLEYTKKTARLATARLWAVKRELTRLEERLARAEAQADGAGSALVLEGLQQLDKRLHLRSLESPLASRDIDALVERARGAAAAGPESRDALDAIQGARVQQGLAGAKLQMLRGLVSTEQEAFADAQVRTSGPAQRERLAQLRGRVRTERMETARLLQDLKDTGRKLSTHIGEPADRPVTRRFASLRGQLPMPTDGVVETGFGLAIEPRFGTATLHKGVDIRAPKDSPVRAVAPGTVAHAGWLRGYGNVLILDHGSGYHTLMAHLDTFRCEVGQRVEAGQEVATVGDSGSLLGAYLYFEVRRRGEAQDPAEWLRLPDPPTPSASAARAAQVRRIYRSARRR
ncbi:MAG: M23 family metallopeptidase [Myxococcaceae bacterium]|nr:M23 family metallopeptidase [Myxococcaceae bacterium]MCI0670183.1 M23 family metallopeptidase [Myxococcaceae bacterium]